MNSVSSPWSEYPVSFHVCELSRCLLECLSSSVSSVFHRQRLKLQVLAKSRQPPASNLPSLTVFPLRLASPYPLLISKNRLKAADKRQKNKNISQKGEDQVDQSDNVQQYLLFIPYYMQWFLPKLAKQVFFDMSPSYGATPNDRWCRLIQGHGPCKDQQFFDVDRQHAELSVAFIRKPSASMPDSHVYCLKPVLSKLHRSLGSNVQRCRPNISYNQLWNNIACHFCSSWSLI